MCTGGCGGNKPTMKNSNNAYTPKKAAAAVRTNTGRTITTGNAFRTFGTPSVRTGFGRKK